MATNLEKSVLRSLRTLKPKDTYNFSKQILLISKTIKKELRRNRDISDDEITETLRYCFPGIPRVVLENVIEEVEYARIDS